MKIKVITLKEIIKYMTKFGLIFGIIAILVNFFYSRKGESGFFSLDSNRFLGALKNEIVLLRKSDLLDIDLHSKIYSSNTIGNEFSMFKVVATAKTDNRDVNKIQQDISDDRNMENIENTDNKEDNKNNVDTLENGEDAHAIQTNGDINNIPTNVSTEVLPSNVPDKTTYQVFGVNIRNECDYNIQNEIKDLEVDFNKNEVIIFHTHTCESYTPTDEFQYESTGNFRTTDLNYSVARVGDELEKYLTNYGISVVHDKSYHDYPSYNGSYNRSLVTVQNLLEKYQNTDVVIDLHRDAIGDNTYAPKVQIGEDCCARLMFVIGTDGGGLKHENWRENVKFAIKVVAKANEMYPGLFKPIIVRNSRYNHHTAKAACIIEVGATGNTLEECMNSMKYLAKIYSEVGN